LQPWIDQQEIVPGDSFLAKMEEGLETASYFVLLVSRTSLKSHWVTREWMASLARKSTIIIPLLLEQCELPALLRDIVYIDATNRQQGLSRLLEFFRREMSTIETTNHDPSHLRIVKSVLTLREIRLVANKCLNDGAFAGFLIDAGINLGKIGGQSLNERVNNLIHHVKNEGIVQSFADWLALEEPRCFDYQLKKVRAEKSWIIRPDPQ
jgi:hypothetical protein